MHMKKFSDDDLQRRHQLIMSEIAGILQILIQLATGLLLNVSLVLLDVIMEMQQ